MTYTQHSVLHDMVNPHLSNTVWQVRYTKQETLIFLDVCILYNKMQIKYIIVASELKK